MITQRTLPETTFLTSFHEVPHQADIVFPCSPSQSPPVPALPLPHRDPPASHSPFRQSPHSQARPRSSLHISRSRLSSLHGLFTPLARLGSSLLPLTVIELHGPPASQQSKSADGGQLLPRLLKHVTAQASWSFFSQLFPSSFFRRNFHFASLLSLSLSLSSLFFSVFFSVIFYSLLTSLHVTETRFSVFASSRIRGYKYRWAISTSTMSPLLISSVLFRVIMQFVSVWHGFDEERRWARKIRKRKGDHERYGNENREIRSDVPCWVMSFSGSAALNASFTRLARYGKCVQESEGNSGKEEGGKWSVCAERSEYRYREGLTTNMFTFFIVQRTIFYDQCVRGKNEGNVRKAKGDGRRRRTAWYIRKTVTKRRDLLIRWRITRTSRDPLRGETWRKSFQDYKTCDASVSVVICRRENREKEMYFQDNEREVNTKKSPYKESYCARLL